MLVKQNSDKRLINKLSGDENEKWKDDEPGFFATIGYLLRRTLQHFIPC